MPLKEPQPIFYVESPCPRRGKSIVRRHRCRLQPTTYSLRRAAYSLQPTACGVQPAACSTW